MSVEDARWLTEQPLHQGGRKEGEAAGPAALVHAEPEDMLASAKLRAGCAPRGPWLYDGSRRGIAICPNQTRTMFGSTQVRFQRCYAKRSDGAIVNLFRISAPNLPLAMECLQHMVLEGILPWTWRLHY